MAHDRTRPGFSGHPILAHIIPTRRCNLSCTYCNEYDEVSKPVPLEEMFRRIDHLARLGTSIITQSGGEPLLHPDLDKIIARVRHHGRLAGMIDHPGQAAVVADAGDDLVQIGMQQRLAAALRDDGGAQARQMVDAAEHLFERHGLRDFVVFVAVRAGEIAAPRGNDVRQDGMAGGSQAARDHPPFAQTGVPEADTATS